MCWRNDAGEGLVEQLESLLKENAQLWEWLDQTIEFSPAKQQEFAVTAMPWD
jgi:histone deacetylase complex regulatory component SIN3